MTLENAKKFHLLREILVSGLKLEVLAMNLWPLK